MLRVWLTVDAVLMRARANCWAVAAQPFRRRAVHLDQRRVTKYDSKPGWPYRVYHAIPVENGQLSLFVYVDIDDASRNAMWKSLVNRREQMVSDGVQLTFDMEHWNGANPTEEPIDLPMDLTPDISWLNNTPDDDDEAA